MVGNFYYGPEHPMKPFRIKMTHQLVLNYGLYRNLSVYVIFIYLKFKKEPHNATDLEMKQFHSEDYIDFIKKISPMAQRDLCVNAEGSKFNIGESDCPAFNGIYPLSQISCGGSIDAAVMLNHNEADICINWAGIF